MVNILLLDVRQIPDYYENLLEKYNISPERKKKAASYKFLKDKKLCIGAGILFDIICTRNHMKVSDRAITYGPKGKPYFRDYREMFFNLSHSGDYAACACGTDEVGIDIEKIDNKADDSFWEDIFTSGELRTLSSIRDEEKINYFYRLWTMKEAFVKTIGEGINIPFRSFEITFGAQITVNQHFNQKEYYLSEYDLQGYKMTACCTAPEQKTASSYESIQLNI